MHVPSANQSVLTSGYQSKHTVFVQPADNPREFTITADSADNNGAQFNMNPAPDLLLERSFMIRYNMVVTLDIAGCTAANTWSQIMKPGGAVAGAAAANLAANASRSRAQVSRGQLYEYDPATTAGNTYIDKYQMFGAPAACPLHRVSAAMILNINDTQISYQPNRLRNPLLHYSEDCSNKLYRTTYPMAADPCNNKFRFNSVGMPNSPFYRDTGYENVANSAAAFLDTTPDDTPANAVGGITQRNFMRWITEQQLSNNNTNQSDSRSQSCKVVGMVFSVPNDLTSRQVRIEYEIVENLFHPLLVASKSRECFANLGRLGISINFQQDLTPAWILDKVNVLLEGQNIVRTTNPNFCTVDFFRSIQETYADTSVKLPQLLLRQYQPSVTIPPTLSIPYFEFTPRTFTMGTYASGATDMSVTINELLTSMVPVDIYFWARPTPDYGSDDTRKGQEADIYAGLKNLVIRTPSNSGLYTGATNHHLYQQMVRNGLKMSYKQWSEEAGSVSRLSVSDSDIGAYTENTKMNFHFNGTFNFVNSTHDSYRVASSIPAFAAGYNDVNGTFTRRGTDFYGYGAGVENTNASLSYTRDWQLMICLVNTGKCTLSTSEARLTTGVDVADVLSTARAGLTPSAFIDPSNGGADGAGLFSSGFAHHRYHGRRILHGKSGGAHAKPNALGGLAVKG